MNKLLRLITIVVVLCNLGSAMLAQSTAIIGAGATTTNTSGATPYTTLWHDSRTQYIILASELSAAGLTEWMDISGLAAGTYILKVTAGNHISTSRIIIK